MKNTIVFFLIILTAKFSVAQSVKYDTSSFINYDEAKKANKLIFINLRSSGNQPRDYLEESGLHHPEAGQFYNKTFINYLYDIKDSAAVFLIKKFKPRQFPVYYFLDAKGNLLYKDSKLDSKPAKYLAMADSALKYKEFYKAISVYQQKFTEETITKTELKDYINLRMALDSLDNAVLIEKYADFMTEEDANDIETILLIRKAGPILGGKAYSKTLINKEVRSAAFKLSANYKPGFTARLIKNTLSYASENKDQALANRLAKFHQFNNNKADYEIEPHSPYILMTYYRNVKDTAKYLVQLAKYYDKYFLMPSDVMNSYNERAKSQLSLNSKVIEARKKEVINPTKSPLVSSTKQAFVLQTYQPNAVAQSLSYGAVQIVNTKVQDPLYLNKGISWSRKAITLEPNLYKAKFALAKLLYRAGFYEEAEKIQYEGIETAKKTSSKMNLEPFKKDLDLIRNRNME